MDPCYEHGVSLVASGVELAPDSQGVPADRIFAHFSVVELQAQKEDSHLWLPAGRHWGLKIEHDHRVLTGPMTNGKPSWLQHITVSPFDTVDAMRDVLHSKHAEVHFVVGGRHGERDVVVIQCLPLNHFGKGMVHLAGHPETNRSGKTQIELCANEASIKHFDHYRALANLFVLVQHRRVIQAKLARSFSNTKRYADSAAYANVVGIHGHMHAPQNSHVDPTPGFEGDTFVRSIHDMPKGGWPL